MPLSLLRRKLLCRTTPKTLDFKKHFISNQHQWTASITETKAEKSMDAGLLLSAPPPKKEGKKELIIIIVKTLNFELRMYIVFAYIIFI